MSYLIILFVIALALAPLSHFVPSKAQRKIARLREHAAIEGLYVEFRQMPKSAAKAHLQRGRADPIYYGKRVKRRWSSPAARIDWLADTSGWQAVPREAGLPQAIERLPPGVEAVSAGPEGCGAYWDESGSETEIDQIRGVLEELAETLYQ